MSEARETELTVRDAALVELPEIVRLLAEDTLGATRETSQGHLPDSYRRAFERIARAPGNRLLVAEAEGRIVGTFQLTFLPPRPAHDRQAPQGRAPLLRAPGLQGDP